MDEEEEAEAARRDRGKPEDHRAVFQGNRDDHFRLGIKVTRQSVRRLPPSPSLPQAPPAPAALAPGLGRCRAGPAAAQSGKGG